MNDEGIYRTGDLRDEDRAFAEISARVVRLRSRVAVATVIVALALAVIGYFVVRAYYLAHFRRFDPRIGFIGVAPPLALMLPVGRWVQRIVVRVRARKWLRTISEQHHIEPERLRSVLEMW